MIAIYNQLTIASTGPPPSGCLGYKIIAVFEDHNLQKAERILSILKARYRRTEWWIDKFRHGVPYNPESVNEIESYFDEHTLELWANGLNL